MRGGKENPLFRVGAALVVAGAVWAAKDSGVAIAGGCAGDFNQYVPLVDRKNYKITEIAFCGNPDNVFQNVLRVDSKTTFLGLPFLWNTPDGTREALKLLKERCEVLSVVPSEGVKSPEESIEGLEVKVTDSLGCSDKI